MQIQLFKLATAFYESIKALTFQEFTFEGSRLMTHRDELLALSRLMLQKGGEDVRFLIQNKVLAELFLTKNTGGILFSIA